MCREKQSSVLTVVVIMVMALLGAVIMWQRVKRDLVEERAAEFTLFTLKEKSRELEAREAQRMATMAVIEFDWDYPGRAFITADRSGRILSADGGLADIGWTEEGLLGRGIHDLRTDASTDIYRRIYLQRAVEGGTGEVHSFSNVAMRGQDGQILMVDGLVMWSETRQKFAGYLARSGRR